MGKHHRNRQEPVNSNTGSPGFVTVTGHHSKSASLPSRTPPPAVSGAAAKPTLADIFSDKAAGDAGTLALHAATQSENGNSERGESRASTGDLSQDDLSEGGDKGHLDRSGMTRSQRRRINRHASTKTKSVDSSDGHPSPTYMDQSPAFNDVLSPTSFKSVMEEAKEISSVSEPSSAEPLSKQTNGAKPPRAVGRDSPTPKKKTKAKVDKKPEGGDANTKSFSIELPKKATSVHGPPSSTSSTSFTVEAPKKTTSVHAPSLSDHQLSAPRPVAHSALGPSLEAKMESFYPVHVETVKVYQPDPEAEELRAKIAKVETELKEKSSSLADFQLTAANLKNLMDSMKQKEEALAKSLALHQKENHDLKAKCSSMAEELTEIQQKKAEKDAVLQDVLSQMNGLEKRVVVEEKEKHDMKREMDLVLKEKEDLMHKVVEQDSQLQRLPFLAEENQSLQHKISELLQETQRLRTEVADEEKPVKSGDNEMEEVKVLRQRLLDAENQLENLNVSQTGELKNLREELEDKLKVTAKYSAQLEAMKVEMAEKSKKEKDLRRKLAAEVKEVSGKNAFADEHLKAALDATAQNDRLKDKLEREALVLYEQSEEVRRQLDMATIKLHRMAELERNNEQMEIQLQGMVEEMAKMDGLQETIRQQEENIRALTVELLKLTEAKNHTETSFYEQSERMMEQQVTLEAAQEQVRRLEQETATRIPQETDLDHVFSIPVAKDTREMAVRSPRPESFHIESQTDHHNATGHQPDKSQQRHVTVAHHVIGVEASPTFVREEHHVFASPKDDKDLFGMPGFGKDSSFPTEDASSASDVKSDLNRTAVGPSVVAPLIDPSPITTSANGGTNGNVPVNGHRASVGAASDKDQDKSAGRKFTDIGSSSFSVADVASSAKEAVEKLETADQRDSLSNRPKDVVTKDYPSSFVNTAGSVKLFVFCGASFGLGVITAYVLARGGK